MKNRRSQVTVNDKWAFENGKFFKTFINLFMEIAGKLNIWKESIHVYIAFDRNPELASADKFLKHRYI